MTLNTRERILEAFFELAKENPSRTRFTFTEIAKQAGLSRQGIYKRHFNNLEEIIDFIHKDLTREFFPSLYSAPKSESPDPFADFTDNIIPYLYQNRGRLKILYKTAIDPAWRSFFQDILQDWIERNMEIDSKKLGFPKEMASHLWACWLAVLIEDWMLEKRVIPPKEFSQLFLNLISSPLKSFTLYEPGKTSTDKLLISKTASKKSQQQSTSN